jgi:adenine phosphoribosyltransferase
MTSLSADSHVRRLVTDHRDFPRAGILFRDLTPVLADADAFSRVIAEVSAQVPPDVTVIAGVEARGFLIAAAVAQLSGRGVIAVRKAGKLPGPVLAERYELEYGHAELELNPDAVPSGALVYLVDDLLATGGTLDAAATLLERCGSTVAGIGVVVELDGLGGRMRLEGRPVSRITVLPA